MVVCVCERKKERKKENRGVGGERGSRSTVSTGEIEVSGIRLDAGRARTVLCPLTGSEMG